jgi:hypothetical protein
MRRNRFEITRSASRGRAILRLLRILKPAPKLFAMLATACAVACSSCRSLADSPARPDGREFLAKAAAAVKSVQEKVKDDKILQPLENAKIKQHEGSLSVQADTRESWPNFPSKPRNLARGYGRLWLSVCADLPTTPTGTPFVPPPGCYAGSTWLVVPRTSSKILVSTTTSDPEAQRRLVDLVVKALGESGITACPADPEKVDSFPRPAAKPPPGQGGSHSTR